MASISVSVANGLGRHFSYLSMEQAEAIALWAWLCQIFWMITAILIRTSVALFLLRIFEVVKIWRRCLFAVICLNVGLGVLGLVVLLAECQPIAMVWNLSGQGTCWPVVVLHIYDCINGGIIQLRYLLATAITDLLEVVSILCDATLATLPVVMLWRAQMNRQTKFNVCSLMALGWL